MLTEKNIPIKPFIITFLFILNSSFDVLSQLASSALLRSQGIISVKPLDFFFNDGLARLDGDLAIPVAFYSEEEIALQKTINEKVSDAILVYSPKNQTIDQTLIDQEEITPYTWKWIEFELYHGRGNKSTVTLRRPNWWINNVGADRIGKKIFMNMPEMGIVDSATVTQIYANQLDTRFWDECRVGDFVLRPITGKFVHESDNVYELCFDGDANPLRVTGNHRIWSETRSDWVEACKIEIGERVKTIRGGQILLKSIKKAGTFEVFNLEIYKDHNYHVSLNSILVHNVCFKHPEWTKLLTMARERIILKTGTLRMSSSISNRVMRVYVDLILSNREEAVQGTILEMFLRLKKMAKAGGAETIEIGSKNIINLGLQRELKAMAAKGGTAGVTVEYSESILNSGRKSAEAIIKIDVK